MNSKLISTSIIAAILILSSLSMLAVPARATTSVKLASLPNCTTQTGLFWDSAHSVAWQPCYDTGILYKEDFSTSPATLTAYDIHTQIGTFNAISLWGDTTNLYLVGRSGPFVEVTAPIASPTSAVATDLRVGGAVADALYPDLFNGILYIPDGSGVVKFNVATSTPAQVTTGEQMVQCADNGANVYCTALAGDIWQITPSATKVFSGLLSPYGIAADSSYVYVAEHGSNDVKKISETTWTVAATSSLPSGATPYGVALYGSYVITDSDGSDQSARNVYVLNVSTLTTANTLTCPVVENGQCRPLFILITDPAGNAYVGFQGSAGSAQISNWQPSSTSSTSTTSTTSTPPPSVCCNPQVIPTITINSTGFAGQHNIYVTHNGSITLTGFQSFMVGGSGGTFTNLGLCDTAVSCAGFDQVQSPSRGTFQSLKWTTPPTMQGPQPVCSLVPYPAFGCHLVYAPLNVVQTSATKIGIFCNNAYIVNTASQCNGNGVPVMYQAFSITVSNLPTGETTITLQATGTASAGQVAINNVIVYND